MNIKCKLSKKYYAIYPDSIEQHNEFAWETVEKALKSLSYLCNNIDPESKGKYIIALGSAYKELKKLIEVKDVCV